MLINKYLWDINIEDIPHGSPSLYQEAKSFYPDGKQITIPYSDGTSKTIWINPLAAYNLSIVTFNSLKNEALNIFENKNTYSLRHLIDSLIEIDMGLYAILLNWQLGFDINSENKLLSDPYTYFDNKDLINPKNYYAGNAVLGKDFSYLDDLKLIKSHNL